MRYNINQNFSERCSNCKFSRNADADPDNVYNIRCHFEPAPFASVEAFDWCKEWVAEGPDDKERKQKYIEAYDAHMQKVKIANIATSEASMPDEEVCYKCQRIRTTKNPNNCNLPTKLNTILVSPH